MGVKATVAEVRAAHAALTRIFEETKLGADTTWKVSRVIGKLKAIAKEFEELQLKAYKDAGGIVDGRGISMDVLQPQQKEESLADYEARRDIYRTKANGLSEDIEKLLAREEEIEVTPITLSMLPKERRNDKGEKEPVEYRATDFANAGQFLTE